MASATPRRPGSSVHFGGWVYVKSGLEKEKTAILVVLVAPKGGSEVVVTVVPVTVSPQRAGRMLRDLKPHGMERPRQVVGDGHMRIWAPSGTSIPTQPGNAAGQATAEGAKPS